VSGIGFLGAGLIIVRRDAVHGLTTAATIWMTAAIGMACGGGLAGLAAAVTALYFIALYGRPPAALLAATLGEVPGVVSVSSDDTNAVDD
jgi:putative Mg2+ transporter-C (MgtC) family protein